MKKKVRYSEGELEEFRLIIERKLLRAKSELNFYLEQIQDLEDQIKDDSNDWSDLAMIISDFELLNDLAERQRKYISELEAALTRVEEKTFGICIVTGHLIDKSQLILAPLTKRSKAAKKDLEEKDPPNSHAQPYKWEGVPPEPIEPFFKLEQLALKQEEENSDTESSEDMDQKPGNRLPLDSLARDLGIEEEYDL